MSLIRVVSLDAFGTLIYPRVPVAHCYSQFAWEACGLYIPPKIIEKNFFTAYKSYSEKYPNFGKFNKITSRSWWHKVIYKTICLSTDCNSINLSSSSTNRLYDWYARAEAWNVYPLTYQVLALLRAKKISIAALSNFDERLPNILYNLEIKPYFEKIIYSHALSCWKPDPLIYDHICDQFNIKPSELLHCGDNFKKDYEAARNFGAHALLIRPPEIFEISKNKDTKEKIAIKDESASKFRDTINTEQVAHPSHIITTLGQITQYIFKHNEEIPLNSNLQQ